MNTHNPQPATCERAAASTSADHQQTECAPSRGSLTIAEILGWADAFHARTGRWPTAKSGPVADAPGETWRNINHSLTKGWRGLAPGSSLSQLLIKERGKPNPNDPSLKIPEILEWARACVVRGEGWPTENSGPVAGAPGETWRNINYSLTKGRRGLPGGSSLAHLLQEELDRQTELWSAGAADDGSESRELPMRKNVRPTTKSIEAARVFREVGLRTRRHSGLLGRIERLELIMERRKAERDLMRELAEMGVPGTDEAPEAQTDELPQSGAGAALEAPADNPPPGATAAKERRRLPSRTTINRLWSQLRGIYRNPNFVPLSVPLILAWADRFHARYGRWPSAASGLIDDYPRDTWAAINAALDGGHRGLPGGSSLARLLAQERGHKPRWSRRQRLIMRLRAHDQEREDRLYGPGTYP
jgi:hypothetical protein